MLQCWASLNEFAQQQKGGRSVKYLRELAAEWAPLALYYSKDSTINDLLLVEARHEGRLIGAAVCHVDSAGPVLGETMTLMLMMCAPDWTYKSNCGAAITSRLWGACCDWYLSARNGCPSTMVLHGHDALRDYEHWWHKACVRWKWSCGHLVHLEPPADWATERMHWRSGKLMLPNVCPVTSHRVLSSRDHDTHSFSLRFGPWGG